MPQSIVAVPDMQPIKLEDIAAMAIQQRQGAGEAERHLHMISSRVANSQPFLQRQGLLEAAH